MASRRLAQQRTLIMSAAVEWLGWDVLAAKWLALLTRIGELVVRPLSLPPGADGLTGSSPLLLFGHDGLTGSSPSLLLAGA